MPIYEYKCAECGFQKEFLQKLSDAPLKDCPECGKSALSKMVTAAGFQLKGSGWYATDFKHGQAKKEADKPQAKGDEKPAVKEDGKPASTTTTTANTNDTPAKKNDTPAKKNDTAEKPAAKAAPVTTPASNS